MRNGRAARLTAYGIADPEHHAAVRQDTPFQIASATKLYTGVLLMRFVEQGKLSLEDPVTRYIPEAPEAWHAILVRHLATHTSGMAPQPVDPALLSTAEVLPGLFKQPLKARPGERAEYGSLDFTVLQHILEKVGGKPYAELLREHVLVPAGMHCTRFDNADQHGPTREADDIPDRAAYYRWTGQANRRSRFLYPSNTYAAGGAYSCIGDVAAFIAALDNRKLLQPASLEPMWTAPRLTDGSTAGFGIGWVVGQYRGQRFVGHSGGPALSDILYFPEAHLGIVVLTNQKKLFPQLASLVADTLLPAPSSYSDPGIQDDAPTLTAAARKALEGMATGSVDASLFPADRKAELADLNEWGPVSVGALAPLSRLVLLEDKTSGGRRLRRYRCLFGSHAQGYLFEFDAQGKLLDFNPKGD